MNENEKNEIIKKVIEELKNKKLFTTSKSSYKSTEKVLYSLNILPGAVKLIEEEVKKLEKESLSIPKTKTKSNTLILNEKEGTYVYGDETLETRISELKQIIIKTRSQIRLVRSALDKIKDNKYYDIIPKYYFEGKTLEKIAEELNCSYGAIYKNKQKLMDKLKVYIFPDTFIKEL